MVGGNLGTPKIVGAASGGSFALRRETTPHIYIYIHTHTPQFNICVYSFMLLERRELRDGRRERQG